MLQHATHCQIYCTCYTVGHKKVTLLFLNSSMQHWPTLIIVGVQHQEETRRK